MTSERPTEDAALVRRSRAGDTDAFTQLVRKYENAAYATALNCVRSVEDAEDIVQDAFIAAYCKLVQLRAPERFGSWLRAIVRTRSLEWIRQQRTLPISACAMGAIYEDLAYRSTQQYASEERNVDIRNRFGTTRFHLNAHEAGSTYRVETDSGEVLVFLKEDLIGEMNLTVNTLCGLVKYDALKSLGGLHTSNTPQLITLSTITSQPTRKLADADLYIRTRDGDVTIEKTM